MLHSSCLPNLHYIRGTPLPAFISAPLKYPSTIASHARPLGRYLGHILFRDLVSSSRPKGAHKIITSTIVTANLRLRLFGSASAQIYNYWWNYPDEPQLHRHAVATVWSAALHDLRSLNLTDISLRLIDTVHTAVCIMALYRWMIVDFNDYQLIQNLSWQAASCSSRIVPQLIIDVVNPGL